MLDGRPGRNPKEGDRNLGRLARRRVAFPEAEVPLEDDRLSIGRKCRPEDAAAREMRERPGGAGRRPHPEVLSPAPVGHEVDGLSVGRPHGPHLAGAGRRQALVPAVALDPDLALVEMARALAPPLGRSDAPRREGEGRSVRRRGRKKLAGVAVGRDRHGRAAFRRNAVDVVHAGDVPAVRREVDPLAVGRPGIELLVGVVVGQALQLSRVERQDVNVAVARAVRGKGEPFAVGGEERARLGRRVRDEEVRRAAGRGRRPDVASRGEDDGAAVGRQRGLGQRGASRRGAFGAQKGAGCKAGAKNERMTMSHAPKLTSWTPGFAVQSP